MRRNLCWAFLPGVLLFLSACSTLPAVEEKPVSYALAAPTQGLLASSAATITQSLAADESAFALLPGSRDAMNGRLALIDQATTSIDAQYFIWKDDASGTLMLKHVFAAADRGVRVRLLVDDMFFSAGGAFDSADQALAAIDYHPNIELRLFNPGEYRDGIMGLAGNFGSSLKTYNRRMHNKLMIFDGHFAVLGGRNIGDEYFGLHEAYNFVDLDVLVAGSVVPQISSAYDEYWNAQLVYPTAALADVDEEMYLSQRKLNADYVVQQSRSLASYTEAPIDSAAWMQALPGTMQRGYGLFLQDKPVRRGGEAYRLMDMLDHIVEPGSRELLISSPYLIPSSGFLEDIDLDSAQGVRIGLLTNSLASNDAAAAHSHYKKYRDAILDSGAELYELHHEPAGPLRTLSDVPPVRGEFVALHIKASVIDSERCFIGSLNMDPRSVVLNTENGLYIESPALCAELRELLTSMMSSDNAWRVERDGQGELQWTSYEGSVDRQPAQDTGQRLADFFFRLLPLESQL